MGSKGKKHIHVNTPNPAWRTNAEPPGGLPPAGSGYEADPLSPAGQWMQEARFIEGAGHVLGRRGKIIVVAVVALMLVAFVASAWR